MKDLIEFLDSNQKWDWVDLSREEMQPIVCTQSKDLELNLYTFYSFLKIIHVSYFLNYDVQISK